MITLINQLQEGLQKYSYFHSLSSWQLAPSSALIQANFQWFNFSTFVSDSAFSCPLLELYAPETYILYLMHLPFHLPSEWRALQFEHSKVANWMKNKAGKYLRWHGRQRYFRSAPNSIFYSNCTAAIDNASRWAKENRQKAKRQGKREKSHKFKVYVSGIVVLCDYICICIYVLYLHVLYGNDCSWNSCDCDCHCQLVVSEICLISQRLI